MKRGERRTETVDSGKREREAERSAGGADCKKSVAQIGRTKEAGDSEQKRLERSPSSTS